MGPLATSSTTFQALLFAGDDEALAQELVRQTALEKAKAQAKARKEAWEAGKPFPEDSAKWAAANPDIVAARTRAWYAKNAEWHLHSTARLRAWKLGCKVGRRSPILKIYRRANSEELIPCYWCLAPTKRGERHVDHIRALAMGGEHSAGNLRIACIECNLLKGDDDPVVFRNRMAIRRSSNRLLLRNLLTRPHP